MSARPMLTVVGLLAASLAGVLAVDPIPQAPEEDPGWDLSGASGSVRVAATDLGWIDFAWPVTEDLDPGDVRINVTVVWRERPMEDRTQFWANAYLGPRYNATHGRAPAVLKHMGEGERHMRDGVVEAHVEAAGQDAGVAAPEPVCTNRCFGNRTGFVARSEGMAEAIRVYHWMRKKYDRPVAHFFVATGGMTPDRLEVDAEWNGTVVTWRVGDPADVDTYYQEDFEHETYADVGTGIGLGHRSMVAPQYADDGTLAFDVSDPPVLFTTLLQVGDAFDVTEEDVEIRRPDGTLVAHPREQYGFPFQAGMAGPWEIWYSGMVWAREYDGPWVRVVDMEWADSAWG